MKSDGFYTAEKITDHMDAVRSRTGEIMYLIRGTERAVLADTCLGVGNIRSVVERMTDLPLTVILTHGHVDHAMGAPLFENVYMNVEDRRVYLAHSALDIRQGYLEAGLGAEPGSFKDAEYVPVREPDFIQPLKDGDTFDLGGIHVEAYTLAGHTPGCMVLLVPEERVLITGDAANHSVFLFDEFSLTVEEYRENVIQLKNRLAGRYDRCFLMHHDMEAGGRLLSNIEQVCDDILSGHVDDIPFAFMGGQYFAAKAFGPGFRRLDGMEGNIIYNKEKVNRDEYHKSKN